MKKAKEGEKYCEYCGRPFAVSELFYLTPGNLVCWDCLEEYQDEGQGSEANEYD